jgi:hypothetical protein
MPYNGPLNAGNALPQRDGDVTPYVAEPPAAALPRPKAVARGSGAIVGRILPGTSACDSTVLYVNGVLELPRQHHDESLAISAAIDRRLVLGVYNQSGSLFRFDLQPVLDAVASGVETATFPPWIQVPLQGALDVLLKAIDVIGRGVTDVGQFLGDYLTAFVEAATDLGAGPLVNDPGWRRSILDKLFSPNPCTGSLLDVLDGATNGGAVPRAVLYSQGAQIGSNAIAGLNFLHHGQPARRVHVFAIGSPVLIWPANVLPRVYQNPGDPIPLLSLNARPRPDAGDHRRQTRPRRLQPAGAPRLLGLRGDLSAEPHGERPARRPRAAPPGRDVGLRLTFTRAYRCLAHPGAAAPNRPPRDPASPGASGRRSSRSKSAWCPTGRSRTWPSAPTS